MVTTHGSNLRIVLFGLLLWTAGAVNAFAQFSDPFSGGAAYSGGALQLTLATSKGCGPGAQFKDGDPITIWFRAGKSATVNLFNHKPNGQVSQPVTNLTVNAGWIYRIDSSVAAPFGTRTLRLVAHDGNVTDSVECAFSAAPSGDSPIVAQITTNRGCGAEALFQKGDPLIVSFSVAENATVRVVNVRPDGEVVLRENFTVEANVVYPLEGNAGHILGSRTLRITATSGDRTGSAECTFTVVDTIPTHPVIASFETNRGCGSYARFREGDTLTVLFRLNEKALVRLTNTRPNGSTVLLDNFLAEANTLYPVSRLIGLPEGARTLKLVVSTGTRTETRECSYEVEEPAIDNTIAVSLTTNRGSGSGLTFKTDEAMQISFSVSMTSLVRVRVVGFGYSKELLTSYEVDAGRRVHLVLDVEEPPGPRTIIVTARSGTHGGQAELAFTATH
jgi:hypothetical protein